MSQLILNRVSRSHYAILNKGSSSSHSSIFFWAKASLHYKKNNEKGVSHKENMGKDDNFIKLKIDEWNFIGFGLAGFLTVQQKMIKEATKTQASHYRKAQQNKIN